MTQQKKTIEVANGTAEEGDRIAVEYYHGLDKEFFTVKGNLHWDEEASVFRVWSEKDGKGYSIDSGDDAYHLFSPTDALEAVEEVSKELKDEYAVELVEHKEFRERLEQRIQQKRKGV